MTTEPKLGFSALSAAVHYADASDCAYHLILRFPCGSVASGAVVKYGDGSQSWVCFQTDPDQGGGGIPRYVQVEGAVGIEIDTDEMKTYFLGPMFEPRRAEGGSL